MDVQKLQRVVVDALEDVKAQDIKVFNTVGLSDMFDRVILASGTSNRQSRALAWSVAQKVKEHGGQVISVEGTDPGEWVLVDLGDIVVHIMQPAIRDYYGLEEMWGSKPVKIKLASELRSNRPDRVGAAEESRIDGNGRVATPARPVAGRLEDIVPAPKRAAKAPVKTAKSVKKKAAKKTVAKKPASTTPARKSAEKAAAANEAPAKKTAKPAASKKVVAQPRSAGTAASTKRAPGRVPGAKGAVKAAAKKAAAKKASPASAAPKAVKKAVGKTAKTAAKTAAKSTARSAAKTPAKKAPAKTAAAKARGTTTRARPATKRTDAATRKAVKAGVRR